MYQQPEIANIAVVKSPLSMYLLFHVNFKKITLSSIAVALILCLLNIFPCLARGNQRAIKVAAIFSYSGPLAEANVSSIRGVRMAVREINSAGGLLDRRLELLEIDNLSTPIGSRMAAFEAVQDNVTAIVGAAFSIHSLAIARVAQDHGIPMITNISTNPLVTRIGDYIFRACYNDLFQPEQSSVLKSGMPWPKPGISKALPVLSPLTTSVTRSKAW